MSQGGIQTKSIQMCQDGSREFKLTEAMFILRLGMGIFRGSISVGRDLETRRTPYLNSIEKEKPREANSLAQGHPAHSSVAERDCLLYSYTASPIL